MRHPEAKNVLTRIDDDMAQLAEKLGDALLDQCYWNCLDVLIDFLIEKKNEETKGK